MKLCSFVRAIKSLLTQNDKKSLQISFAWELMDSRFNFHFIMPAQGERLDMTFGGY